MDSLQHLVTDALALLKSVLSNSLFAFILGNVTAFYIWRHLDKAHTWWTARRERRHITTANRLWDRYKHLASGLQVVQQGWKDQEFTEDQVVVTVERAYQLPPDIVSHLRAPHEAEWESLHLEDNPQVGLFAIDAWRVSDEPLKLSHLLRLSGQTYKYYDFLSTHRLLLSGTTEERAFLGQKVGTPHYLTPVPEFPNPLSVGLSLFCEEGNCLVLTRRTKLASSGGLWSANAVFNAVGENVSLEKDAIDDYRGFSRVSPWRTAKRGLEEEVGFDVGDAAGASIHLHSFVWDTRILDYKFFGYAISRLSRKEVEQRCWANAPDRHESWAIEFIDCASDRQCADIVRRIARNKSDWSSEAILSTILSLLHARGTTWSKLG